MNSPHVLHDRREAFGLAHTRCAWIQIALIVACFGFCALEARGEEPAEPSESYESLQREMTIHRARDVQIFAAGGLVMAAMAGFMFLWLRRSHRALVATKLELETADRFQRAVLDSAAFGVVVVSADDGIIRVVNQGAERILGRHRDELVGISRPSIFHDSAELGMKALEYELAHGIRLRDPAEVIFAEARAGRRAQAEWTFRRPDGSPVAVWLDVAPLQASCGRTKAFAAVFLDLTERKAAEAALRESRSRLSTIFHSMTEGLVLFDNRGVPIECNAALERLLGVGRDMFMKPEFWTADNDALPRLLVEEGAPIRGRENVVREVLQSGKARRGAAVRIERGDDSVTWVFCKQDPIYDSFGRVTGVVATFADITTQRLAVLSMRESEERFRLNFDYAGVGMCLISLNGQVTRVNRRLCEILNEEEAELCRKDLRAIIDPEDLEQEQKDLKALYSRVVPFKQRDMRLRRSDESVVWVRRTAVLLRNTAGEPLCLSVQIEDITDRRQFEMETRAARDRALELASLKSQFLANMSHEIRTPMNGIVATADLLSESVLDSDQAELVRLLRVSADSLLTVINDILDFSKIEAGRLHIESVPFEPAQVIRDSVALFAARARQKGLEFTCSVDPVCGVSMLGDPVRLRQILSNLVGNAIKFTERGSVVVQASLQPGRIQRLRIDVADTGIGIPEDRGSQLFQPFTQADQSHTRKFGGTGLGLAICRQLVSLMNGEIGVSSEVGQGSIFWIELPLHPHVAPKLPAGETTHSSHAPSARPVLQRPLRLLVAEDNATNRAVIARMLQHPMLSVDFATNGHMALNLLARQAYDAVLMDCQMPEVDGFEATRQIRSGKLPGVNASVPVIALTAYAMPEDRERCVAAGMTDYLAKPVKYPALQAVMERCGLVLPDRLASGTSAPMPVEETAACDPQQLAMIERLGPVDGPPLLPALTRILFNETPGRLVELWTHLETRNAPELARIAHLLGGSVANFGAKTLRQLLLEVEKAGSQGDWARADALANELEPEWTRVRRFLEEKVDLESQTA